MKFAPDVLRRVVALFGERKLDHLALLGDVERSGFWDTVLISFFGMGFQLATNPHNVNNPNSRTYVGVGAFQMLSRAAYERSGTHRRLAMEVVDDMKLGKIVKMARVSFGCGCSAELRVRRVALGPAESGARRGEKFLCRGAVSEFPSRPRKYWVFISTRECAGQYTSPSCATGQPQNEGASCPPSRRVIAGIAHARQRERPETRLHIRSTRPVGWRLWAMRYEKPAPAV